MKSTQQIAKLALLVSILAFSPVITGCFGSDIGSGGVIESNAADCKFANNPLETANSFISRCRKAGIRGEFPDEYLYVMLGEIDRDKSARGRKARKLLTRNKWKK